MVYKKMIVGITGPIASGKDVFTKYLVKKFGFKTFSLSTIIHDFIKKNGLKSVNRGILQDIGNELRKASGNDILAKKAMALIEKENWDEAIITGIRNPAEVRYFKKTNKFILFAIKSSRKIRFQRMLRRAKPWDPKDWKTFLEIDRRDLGYDENHSGQQVKACMKLADYTLTNNRDIKTFEEEIKKIISQTL